MPKKTPKLNESIVTARLVARFEDRYLVAQRRGGSQDGLWEFPGGKVDLDDFRRASYLNVPAFAVAACREFREEIGHEVSPAIVGRFVTYNRIVHPDGVEQNAHAALVDLQCEPRVDRYDHSEVSCVELMPLGGVLELMMWGEFRHDMVSLPARLGLIATDVTVPIT